MIFERSHTGEDNEKFKFYFLFYKVFQNFKINIQLLHDTVNGSN